jgi:hypothetical protein
MQRIGGSPVAENSAIEQAAFIEVEAEVRYWKDAKVNGIVDDDGSRIPGREGDVWKIRIDLLDGIVVGWPEGVEADVFYKVCDQGDYWLADHGGTRIAKWRGSYVPDAFLCHGEDGFGDYIILSVAVGGGIEGYRTPPIEPAQWQPIDDPTFSRVTAGCAA